MNILPLVEGHLDFRSLYFEQELLDIDNYQGNAVINYTDADIPYTDYRA